MGNTESTEQQEINRLKQELADARIASKIMTELPKDLQGLMFQTLVRKSILFEMIVTNDDMVIMNIIYDNSGVVMEINHCRINNLLQLMTYRHPEHFTTVEMKLVAGNDVILITSTKEHLSIKRFIQSFECKIIGCPGFIQAYLCCWHILESLRLMDSSSKFYNKNIKYENTNNRDISIDVRATLKSVESELIEKSIISPLIFYPQSKPNKPICIFTTTLHAK